MSLWGAAMAAALLESSGAVVRGLQMTKKADDQERERSPEEATEALTHHFQARLRAFAVERLAPLCPACGRQLPAPPVSEVGIIQAGVAYAVACPGSNCYWQGKAVFVREQAEDVKVRQR